MLRIKFERKDKMVRVLSEWVEVAYCVFGLCGLGAEVEFPSDWHEEKMGWVRFKAGLFRAAIAFPWSRVVPDNYQCSGPTYGFNFYEDLLFVHWGKSNGRADDPTKTFQMPWGWRFKKHKILSAEESHPYTYTLRSGEKQHRTATIFKESREWVRPWLPRRSYREMISVSFNDEVGERSGSWKGGVLGCSYTMQSGETPVQCLRRMEQESIFS